ncbi:hypothetical protein BU24DRAFT_343096 [Aaosphaeria arxii CBS 175.79]|uniref:F-box domain-containing protein n=1 Tax=Aaosphaeria arxii CBS 175.79 TaxID=1450172 RepID=A0A6A5XZP8_9PLEO|nr:uncharacterized protein BU24DRAFT_343096 [Aaosphaeria arxii CBS 175.79]KAF2018393.1 hypothetical protein BU24DRAFT_343096 [Aaosphaeria arxii CBS 175.79]
MEPDNNNNNIPNTEAELESFRQKWREEVSAKSKDKSAAGPSAATTSKHSHASSSKTHAHKGHSHSHSHTHEHSHARHRSIEEIDEVEPHVYPDLGDKQHGRRLDETSAPSASSSSKEPRSALEHYEKAVEKESQGSLGDSLNLYRKAFKLDSNVHQTYKNKHFPPSFFQQASKPKPQDPNPSNAPVTVPNTAHHSLQGTSSTLQNLLEEFSSLSIQGEPPPTDLSPPPPCPIASIPDEILTEVLLHLAIDDVASFVRLAQVCKRLAYLVHTEEQIWKRIALGPEFGFAAMHYDFACQLDGKPLGHDGAGGYELGTSSSSSDTEDDDETYRTTTSSNPTAHLVPTIYPTYRALFRQRPRIRFNGCYISTVNYTRPGAPSPTTITWNSPIHIVTYYRYLRFFRDGTCISLLTTSEPADVVPYLHMEHVHRNHGNLPSAPMKDSLLGRWRLSGPSGGEKEGTLFVETQGSTPKYWNRMILSLATAGKGARNNKLNWQGYYDFNRLTDDWGVFNLKNDRPFYWSRVRSFGMGWEEGGTTFKG